MFADILALQSEVARRIAGEVDITLTSQEQARLASAGLSTPRRISRCSWALPQMNRERKTACGRPCEYFETGDHQGSW